MMEHKSKPLELYSRNRRAYVHKTDDQKVVVENPNKVVAQNRTVGGGTRARRPSPKLYATVRSGVPIQLAQESVEQVWKKDETVSYQPVNVPIHKPIVDQRLKPDLLSGIRKPRTENMQSAVNEMKIKKLAEQMQTPNIDDDEEIHPDIVDVTLRPNIQGETRNPRRFRPFKRRNTEGPVYKPRTCSGNLSPTVGASVSEEDDEHETLFESALFGHVNRNFDPPKDGIRMVIANRDHPYSLIGARRADLIQMNLIELIDETASQCQAPRFHSTEFNDGVMELICANLHSKKWLQEQLPNVEDPELILVTPEEIEKMNIMVQVRIPDTTDELSIITRLSSQNPGLAFDDWELVFMRKCFPGRQLCYAVDKESFKLLEKLGFQLHYGLGMITFRPVSKKKP